MKIIADKNIPYLKGKAELLGEVTYLAGSEFTKEAIKEADVLIVRTVTYFGRDLLEGSKIKLICSATIGYDHIDTLYCEQNNIAWLNAPGCNSGSVQQYIASALICMARKQNFELKNKTIGIVGVGNVGTKVAHICRLLGMRILLCDPPRKRKEPATAFVDLETIKQEADIITFHTPLIREGVDKTYHLADRSFFETLHKQPIIINSARGAIIDTQAIKEALMDKKIAGAVIDCWENEPAIDREYLRMVDIATPHIAGYSADGKANATRMAIGNLCTFFGLDASILPPFEIPEPSETVIEASRLSINDILLRIYSPYGDMMPLMNQPDRFFDLRVNYPLRREYAAYTIKQVNKKDVNILNEMGFVICD